MRYFGCNKNGATDMPTSITPALRDLDGFSIRQLFEPDGSTGICLQLKSGSKHIMDNEISASVMPSPSETTCPWLKRRVR